MNCKNCGAIVKDCKCEYCGTEYPEYQTFVKCQKDISAEINRLFSNGNVYIQEVVREPIIVDSYRNEKGMITHSKMVYKTKIKLVEV